MFKHIVVGCDGTPEGRDAVALGGEIASATGAGLSLVGVFPTSLFPIAGMTDRKTLRAEATQTLRRERDRLAPGALIHVVADTSVPRALRRAAERWRADLVIIGSSPDAPPGHVAIGRRGRQLLNDAPFSLGIAARGLHERPRRTRAIGVGFDGGPEAQAALTLAAELAHATKARLEVRRVVEEWVPVLTSEQWMGLEDWDHRHVWEEARKGALADTEAAVSRLGIPAEASATVGDPGYELRALSETVDLLVVGSRRWGTVVRLVTGAVGEAPLPSRRDHRDEPTWLGDVADRLPHSWGKGRLRPFAEPSILAERLSGITDWLGRRPDTADLRVGYLGIGQAATVALQAAAQLGDSVGAIVLIGIPDATEMPSQFPVPILLIGNGSVEDHRSGARLQHHFGGTLRLEVSPGAHTLGAGDPGPHKRAFNCAADWFTHYLEGHTPHEVDLGDSAGRGAGCAPRRPLRRRKPPRRRAVRGTASAA